MYKTSRISEEMNGKISVIDHYAKDSGAGVVSPSCSFYHDPLQHQLSYLARYKANIHKLGSNSFSEPVHVINSEPYVLKCVKAHGKNYTKVRPFLVRHL